jgi:succinoglycan biosynthesis transport protein ExoP
MSDLVQRESEYLPPAVYEPVENRKGNPLLRLLNSARRHWVMVLLVWIFTATLGSILVWRLEAPTYTASTDVKIDPLPTPILYPDIGNLGSGFENFFNTQVQLICSSPVLNAALADPNLKGLPLLDGPDPLAALRLAVTAGPVAKSNLLRVNVTQRDPDSAIRIARAVIKSYEAFAGGNEARERENRIRVLKEHAEGLRKQKERLNEDINLLAQEEASSSEAIYDALRESTIRIGSEALLERGRAEAERIQLQARLEQLEKGLVPTTMPAEDLNWREQQIENDEVVRSIRAKMAEIAQWLVKPRISPAYEEEMRRLNALLEKERARAGREADRRLEERHRAILEGEKQRVREALKAVESRIAFLDESRAAAEKEGRQLGRVSLEIKRLQDKIASCDEELKRTEAGLNQLELEGHRPARISVLTDAEILPDGIRDRRLKFTCVAIMGGLCFSLCLAAGRDILQGRLYNAQDMDSQTDLRLLGSVPSLNDLRRGRVTKDDFRESYRNICATLAGQSSDGRIPHSLLITSGQAAEGKTSLAVSLAAQLAESGCRVLVIDGDVQAPRIGQTLNLERTYRLRDVLLGNCQFDDAVSPTPVSGLEVLLGSRNGQSAEGLLTYRRAARIIKEAAEHYDHVIVDSPPVLGAADAVIWAQVVDGVILSSFAGHSSLRIIRQACQRINAAGGRILGAVICNVSARESYYSYSFYSTARSRDIVATGRSAGSADTRVPCIQLGGNMLTTPLHRDNPKKT